jgi:hypothetical protein
MLSTERNTLEGHNKIQKVQKSDELVLIADAEFLAARMGIEVVFSNMPTCKNEHKTTERGTFWTHNTWEMT